MVSWVTSTGRPGVPRAAGFGEICGVGILCLNPNHCSIFLTPYFNNKDTDTYALPVINICLRYKASIIAATKISGLETPLQGIKDRTN